MTVHLTTSLCTPNTMTSTYQYKTCSRSNSIADAYESEKNKFFIDLVPQDTQPKEKGKVLGFERHTIDLKIHLYHKSLPMSSYHLLSHVFPQT